MLLLFHPAKNRKVGHCGGRTKLIGEEGRLEGQGVWPGMPRCGDASWSEMVAWRHQAVIRENNAEIRQDKEGEDRSPVSSQAD